MTVLQQVHAMSQSNLTKNSATANKDFKQERYLSRTSPNYAHLFLMPAIFRPSDDFIRRCSWEIRHDSSINIRIKTFQPVYVYLPGQLVERACAFRQDAGGNFAGVVSLPHVRPSLDAWWKKRWVT